MWFTHVGLSRKPNMCLHMKMLPNDPAWKSHRQTCCERVHLNKRWGPASKDSLQSFLGIFFRNNLQEKQETFYKREWFQIKGAHRTIEDLDLMKFEAWLRLPRNRRCFPTKIETDLSMKEERNYPICPLKEHWKPSFVNVEDRSIVSRSFLTTALDLHS